jgi:hypothetical protein
MIGPYIGITDFMTEAQSRTALDLFEQLGGPRGGRKLMVGVMMSYKTLNGLPTKWTAAFPWNEDVAGIFVRHPAAYNTLHYADYDGVDVGENLALAAAFGGPDLDAIQLDMVWPDPDVVRRFRDVHPAIEIVLQANAVALGQVGNDPAKFIAMIDDYGPCLDHVLLDKSMGRGLGLDAQALLPFARALAEKRPDLGIAAAGGLGPDTLGLVEPLVREFPRISIDAQSKLRPSGSALDPIDWMMARQYLERAIDMFGRHDR